MDKTIAHNYARALGSDAGRAVMAHLRSITIERWLGPGATDAELRSLEARPGSSNRTIGAAGANGGVT